MITGLCLAVLSSLLLVMPGCRKTEYNVIQDAAYLRVFNSLNYLSTVITKDQPPPFVTMIIDPTYDAKGIVTGGKIMGDFLDTRDAYAPPYPANAGSTSFRNKEYPGYEKVLAGPILNGINLSSWAQVPSGQHRVLFYGRPISPMPFFQLEAKDRQSLLVDSTINLSAGEVYTMELLQKNINPNGKLPAALYLREEQFTKRAFSDSLLYVNFYNLSAEGYAAAHPGGIYAFAYYNITNQSPAYADTLNLFYSLYRDDCKYPYAYGNRAGNKLIPGYNNIGLGTIIRSHAPDVKPYYSIPMFAAPDTTGGILSRQWELFVVMAPGLSPLPGQVAVNNNLGMQEATSRFGAIGCSNISCDGKGIRDEDGGTLAYPMGDQLSTGLIASCWLPNLIKYTASGSYAQRSFATISTIEIINNQVYMMSVQRTYAPPNH